MSQTSLPFKITDDAYGGFAEVEGILRIDSRGLELEFMVKDAIFGIVKSAPKNIRISFADIAEVRYKKGMWNGKLIIRANNLKSFGKLPGSKTGFVKLVIPRRVKKMAPAIIKSIQLRTEGEQPQIEASTANQPFFD